MITEKLREIDNLISQEIAEYNNLSKLYDDKKYSLIKLDLNSLSEVDNKINEQVCIIKNIEEKRKVIDKELGIENATMSNYLELAQQNSVIIEKKLLNKKTIFQDLNKKITNQEKINIELLKHGMGTTNKLIKIIVDGVMKSSQYNNYGKNVKDESIGISSIVEEV
ncbi:flagellar export chaperone FlgN [bacterium]|nr:flagellar export chaperone FlgN [bacterium]